MPVSSTTRSLAQHFDPRVLAALEGLDFKARYVMEGFLAGCHASPFHGFSVEFSDYRTYQAGDDLRHVDWRLFARSDRLYLKRYQHETNVRFYLVCDTSRSMAYRGRRGWGSKLEVARILAAAVGWFLLRQNDAAGLIALREGMAAPDYVRPSQHGAQLGMVLRRLEALEPTGGAQLAELLRHAARLVHRRSVVLLFTDLLEPAAELERGFRELRFHGHECIVFQVLDPDEVDFPFAGPEVFEDPETGVRREVVTGAARAGYLARFEAFMDEHRRVMREQQIPHCRVRTDENPWRALALFLARRRQMQ